MNSPIDYKIRHEQLEQINRLIEAANRAKTDFLTNMSHEFRTPLKSILGFAECLTDSRLDSEQRKFLSIVQSSGKNLSKSLSDVLALGRLEIGKLVLDEQEFNFTESVSEALTPYRYIANEKGLDFHIHFSDSIPHEKLIGDANKLNQIIINLVSNALKFTSNGSIKIKFGLKNNINSKKNEVVMEGVITDTGVGVPSDKKDIIFESFMQADNSVTRNYGGSILGLSIVKQLVNLMQGDISVESPLQKEAKYPGSEFTFHLCLKYTERPTENTEKPTENIEKPETLKKEKLLFDKKYKILVVDDNDMNQLLAKRMLKEMGAEVTVVDNGQKAIEIVASENFDLVLMDVQMPVMNGIDATIKLRENHFDKPILSFSAHLSPEDIENCLKSGMNGSVSKPFTKQEIFETISKKLSL